MANLVKHKKTSTKPAPSDSSRIGGPDWNDEHVFAGGAMNSLLMRDTGQSDGASWTATPTLTTIIDSGLSSVVPQGDNPRDRGTECLRLKFDSGVRGISRDGSKNLHLVRVASVPGIDGGVYDWMMLGDTRMNHISMNAPLDMIQQDIIDVRYVGNYAASGAGANTRLVQRLPAVDGGASKTVGVATLSDAGAVTDRLVCNNCQTAANSYVRVVNAMIQHMDGADTQPRLEISNGGNVIKIGGGGSTAPEITLSRTGANILKLEDANFILERDSTGNVAFSVQVTGESFPRIQVTANGTINLNSWGGAAPNVNLYASTDNVLKTDDTFYVGGWIEGAEISAPGAPPANGFRLYGRDNGSGKTQLVVIFPTGVVQVLASEP